MKKCCQFLNEAEEHEFRKPSRVIPREIVWRRIDKTHTSPRPKEVDLVGGIVSEIGRLRTDYSSRSAWTGFVCVGVNDDDGMTWSAQLVDAAIEERFPDFTRLPLSAGRAFPDIAALISPRRLLRIAVACKVIPPFFTWYSPAALAILAVVFVLSCLYEFSRTSSTSTATILVGAAATVLMAFILRWSLTRPSAEALRRLRDEIQKGIQKGLSDFGTNHLSEGLAQELLSGPFPRAVIIDGYDRLDPLSRSAIERYLNGLHDHRLGSEFWVVFEGRRGHRLSNRLLMRIEHYPFQAIAFCDQSPLSPAKRRQLASILGNNEDLYETDSIKTLCHRPADAGHCIERLLDKHHADLARAGKRYGSLDFLSFLSANATTCNCPLNVPFLIPKLASTNLLRTQLLREILVGTACTLSEYECAIEDVRQGFPEFLLNVEDRASLHISPLTAHELDSIPDRLPPSGLAHLYWGLFWHDHWNPRWTNEAHSRLPEAFWVHKIAYHLRKADVSAIANDDLRQKLSAQLADTLFSIIEKSIVTCDFREPRHLLEKAFYLVLDLARSGKPEFIRRLLATCWHCYATLADKEILTWIVRLYLARAEFEQASRAETSPTVGTLGPLFLDMLSVPFEERILLDDSLRRISEIEPRLRTAISGYLESNACWLATCFCQLPDRSRIREAIPFIDIADSLSDSLIVRLTEEFVRARTDKVDCLTLLSLAMAIWAHCLSPRGFSVREETGMAEAGLNQEVPRHRHLEQLLEVAESLVLRCGDILEPKGGPVDFLVEVAARELRVTCLACLVATWHDIQRVHGLSSLHKWRGTLAEIAKECSIQLSLDPAAFDQTDGLCNSEVVYMVDDAMRIGAMLWGRLGLEHLGDNMNIRRLQFVTKCFRMQPEAVVTEFQTLLDSLGSAVNHRSWRGLVGNLVVAAAVRQSCELTAYYIWQAFSVCDAAGLGSLIVDALSLTAVECCHDGGYDLGDVMSHMLEPRPQDNCLLRRYLSPSDDELTVTRAFLVVNAVVGVKSPVILKGVQEILCAATERVEDPAMKEQLDVCGTVCNVTALLVAGEKVDYQAVCKKYSSERLAWVRAWTLSRILTAGQGSEETVEDGLKLLARDARLDSMNTFHDLARLIAERLPESRLHGEPMPSAVSYLFDSVAKWECISCAADNVTCYAILYDCVPERRDFYGSKLAEWQSIELQWEQVRSFPDLAKQGEHFLVFQAYCMSMRHWGLPVDGSWSDVLRHRFMSGQERVDALDLWRVNGAEVPSAIMKAEGVISGEFLRIGYDLFGDSARTNAEFDLDRRQINAAAREALPQLLDMILRLDRMPDGIRRLVHSFAERFTTYELAVE